MHAQLPKRLPRHERRCAHAENITTQVSACARAYARSWRGFARARRAVVAEDVNLAEHGRALVHHLLALLRAAHVRDDGDDLDAVRAPRGGAVRLHGRQLRRVARHQAQVAALRGEGDGQRGAQAAARADEQHGLRCDAGSWRVSMRANARAGDAWRAWPASDLDLTMPIARRRAQAERERACLWADLGRTAMQFCASSP